MATEYSPTATRKKKYKVPAGLTFGELDYLMTEFQFALGGLLELHTIPMSKVEIQKRWIGRPTKHFYCLGGPTDRRFSKALAALREVKVPKGFIQQLFDAAYEAEYAVISQDDARECIPA